MKRGSFSAELKGESSQVPERLWSREGLWSKDSVFSGWLPLSCLSFSQCHHNQRATAHVLEGRQKVREKTRE